MNRLMCLMIFLTFTITSSLVFSQKSSPNKPQVESGQTTESATPIQPEEEFEGSVGSPTNSRN